MCARVDFSGVSLNSFKSALRRKKYRIEFALFIGILLPLFLDIRCINKKIYLNLHFLYLIALITRTHQKPKSSFLVSNVSITPSQWQYRRERCINCVSACFFLRCERGKLLSFSKFKKSVRLIAKRVHRDYCASPEWLIDSRISNRRLATKKLKFVICQLHAPQLIVAVNLALVMFPCAVTWSHW